MKKMLLILALLLVAGFAFGQDDTFYPITPPTLEWDAPADTSLPGDVVEYEVYGWDERNGPMEIQPIASLISLGTTPIPIKVIAFPQRAPWRVGVRLKHTDGGGNVGFSGMIYSIVEGETLTGRPFEYFPVLQALEDPTDLRDSGTVVP